LKRELNAQIFESISYHLSLLQATTSFSLLQATMYCISSDRWVRFYCLSFLPNM